MATRKKAAWTPERPGDMTKTKARAATAGLRSKLCEWAAYRELQGDYHDDDLAAGLSVLYRTDPEIRLGLAMLADLGVVVIDEAGVVRLPAPSEEMKAGLGVQFQIARESAEGRVRRAG